MDSPVRLPDTVVNGLCKSQMEAALAYVGAGFGVTPCRPADIVCNDGSILKAKAPKTRHGFKNVLDTERKVRDHFSHYPNDAIGLPTGQQRVVVIDGDLDENGEPAGQREFLAFIASIPDFVLATAWQKTASGGCQYLFTVPPELDLENVKNAVGKGQDGKPGWPELPHCDVRAVGGGVIVAPTVLGPYSKNPKGGAYQWQDGIASIQTMPKELYDILPKKRASRPASQPQSRRPALNLTGKASPYSEKTLEYLASDLASTQEGGRNYKLNSYAIRAFRLFMADGADFGPIYDALRRASEVNGYISEHRDFDKVMAAALKKAEEEGPAQKPERARPLTAPRPAVVAVSEDAEEKAASILPPPWDAPTGLFPECVEDALADIAKKLCDNQYQLVLGPFLWAVGSAIGGKRLIAVKDASPQPAVTWAASLGGQGVGKTPGAEPFTAVFNARCADAFDEWERACKSKAKEIRDYRQREKKGQLSEGEEIPETPPFPPMPMLSGDTTMEALGKNFKAFRDNGRIPTTAIFCDELRHGLKALGCYHAGGSGAEDIPQQLLSLYDGGSWQTTRVNEQRNAVIPHCYLSLYGGLQTGLVPDVFTEDTMLAGGLARFEFFRGEAPADAEWNGDDLNHQTKLAIPWVINTLLDMPDVPETQPTAGNSRCIDLSGLDNVIRLTPEAKEAHAEWFKRNRTAAQLEGRLGFFNKRSKQSSRNALIIHLVRQLFLKPENREPMVTAETMEKAFMLDEYLRHTLEEVLMLANAGRKAAMLEAVHRKAARIFLRHAEDIADLKGIVPNSTILEWLKAGGLASITSGNLRTVCTPLMVAAIPHTISRGVRGRRFSDETMAVLKVAAGEAE